MRDSTASPRLNYSEAGAQILQAYAEVVPGMGADIFYLSPLPPRNSAPVRGGVPVLFPQFADRGPLPKHGLVRTAPWTLRHESRTDQANSVVFELALSPCSSNAWLHSAHLVMEAEASWHGLLLRLRVTNTGTDTFAWTGGLHPYFAVEDVLTCSVVGLSRVPVQDRYNQLLDVELADPFTGSDKPLERLYGACPPLTLFTGSRTLSITASGFDQWMVWNPGRDDGEVLPDLPAGDWQRFVCIEPVCVSRPVSLLPGQSFTGTLDIRWRPHTFAKGRIT